MWRVAVDELCALRTLHESDLSLVEMMVMAAYRHRQAQAHIEQLGMLVKGSRGPMVNPLLKTERDEAATYLHLAETLGLTPVARLRLGLISLSGQSILAAIDAELEIVRV
jgi:P27 family predicted phage terminase small subunit